MMVQVKANGAMLAIFGPIKERAEILDDRGTLLGYFEPASEGEDALYRHAVSLFDPEDVRKSQLADGPWVTTGELIERLRSSGDA